MAKRERQRSDVVREAMADDHKLTGKLTEAERLRLLKIVAEIRSSPVARSESDVDREIAEIRAARRSGRRHSS
jgi:hypothetical protein